ncbi:hypothetical protein E4U52_000021 [Claviceps spartinae]|nr:hypothetical protein E4U52_000021 [Claviceps spartinae]
MVTVKPSDQAAPMAMCLPRPSMIWDNPDTPDGKLEMERSKVCAKRVKGWLSAEGDDIGHD